MLGKYNSSLSRSGNDVAAIVLRAIGKTIYIGQGGGSRKEAS